MLSPSLLFAPLVALVPQDELSRDDVERRVRAYLALDPSSPAEIAEGRRILNDLAGVPYPSARELKRWQKLFERTIEERHDRQPIQIRVGEHQDPLRGRTGRYFIGGRTNRPRGLFVGLHGGGVDSGDARSAWSSWKDACSELGWLGLFPEVLEKTERGWTDAGTEEWVMGLVERAVDAFGIDPGQVVIGGHSMGGYGAWVLGAHHADRFAAAVASAGAPTPVYQGGRITAIQKGVVPNLSNLPMLVFQSTDDPKVPPDANQAAVRAVEEARERFGGYEHFEYWEVNDRGHGFPDGGAAALLARVAGYARDPQPSQVVWQPDLSWKRQFYWLHWDEPDLGATVVARRDRDENSIEVDLRRTTGEGLSILLDETLVDLERPVIVRVNGRRVFEGLVEPSFVTLIETAANGDAGRRYVARVPVFQGD